MHLDAVMKTQSDPTTGPERERDLREMLTSAPIDSEHLRQAIRAHAASLRENGMPPEQMLAQVKQLIAPAMALRRPPYRSAADHDWDLLRLTRWAVESYYGLPGREHELRVHGSQAGFAPQDLLVADAGVVSPSD